MEQMITCPHCGKQNRDEDLPSHGRRCGYCGESTKPMGVERQAELERIRDTANLVR